MRLYSFVAVVAALTSSLSAQGLGQLDPPAGPVSDTGKSLDNLPPSTPISAATTPGNPGFSLFTITGPGRYHLTGDIVTGGDFTAISISLSGSDGTVEIDLAGFEIDARLTTTRDVIVAQGASASRLTVHSGTIRGGRDGIRPARALHARDLTFIGTGAGAAILLADGSLIERCSFEDLAGSGVLVNVVIGDEVTVRDCTFENVAGNGVIVGSNSRVERVTINRSDSTTATGVLAGRLSVVRDVTVSNVFGRAVVVGSNSLVSGLLVDGVAAGIAEYGVELGTNSRLTASVLNNYNGTLGMVLAGRNVAIDGVTINDSEGFGIFASEPSVTLMNSFVDDTQGAAVSLATYNTVRNNSIEARNSNAPSLVVGSHSVIDSNRFFGNVTITGTENQVTRNILDFGDIIETPSATLNDIGPINDLSSPWTNFDR